MEEALANWNPDMIICDESQRIKTPGAKQSKAMHRLGKRAKYKLTLTGTPVTQGPLDFFSQYKFLDPSIFGNSYYAFRARYAVMGGYERKQVVGYNNLPELIRKAHSIAFRVTKEEALDLPRGNLMLIVTGSQGERRAASAQLSRGKYLGLELKEGDTFLFSSKTIPGNERDVIRVMNAFSEIGVEVIDDRGGLYHVSGHANRPDLEAVHELLRPKMLLPMHGEHRHLREHCRIGIAKGITAELAVNGTVVDLTGDAPEVVEYVETGRTYLDGTVLLGALDGVVRDRIRMALNGHVLVTVLLDEEDQPLGEAWVELKGLSARTRKGAPLAEAIEADLNEFLERADDRVLADDDKMEEAVRKIVRQVAVEEIGKKPEITVVTSRLVAE